MACSNSATLGPCVTQPERITCATALTSCSSKCGAVMGIVVTVMGIFFQGQERGERLGVTPETSRFQSNDSSILPTTRAGTPRASVPGGMSLVTTAPAPTTAPSPTDTPATRTAPVLTQALRWTVTP